MLHHKDQIRANLDDAIFGNPIINCELPKYHFPQTEISADVAEEVVRDELFLDGNSRQNLATFCQTYAEPQVHHLMDLALVKNMIDKDEYPQTAELESRCVHMLAELWHAPDQFNCVGTSTVGSSEACMLGGLAMLRRWRKKRSAAGQACDKPNLVCGPVQLCWEKFCCYWDIELRQIPMEENAYHMTAENMLPYLDENTIGLVTTFGLTFTGVYEPVAEICRALDAFEASSGLDLDLHVDAASGGFLAPFCAEELVWDFRLPRVKSISTSGHKYGLAPLGCGWVIWRDKADLPEELIFHVNYLGGDMAVFQLNFSRPAGQVISQYYLFNRLGREGYRKIQQNCYATAQYLKSELEKVGLFTFLHGGDPGCGLPAVTWRFKDGAKAGFSLYDLADRLRTRGWLVPAYSLPANAESIVVQRIIVRQGFSRDMAALLINDLRRELDLMKQHPVSLSLTEQEAGGFKHT